jgi:DNA polymerase-3 subunit epsilon
METTGTDPAKHGIIQIAGAVVIDGEMKEKFDWKVRPLRGDMVSPEACKVNGVTVEQMREFPEAPVVFGQLLALLGRYVDKFNKKDKFFFVGFNSTFDDSFLRRFWDKNGDSYYGSWFWWPSIDVAVLAANRLGDARAEMPNFKLTTVAEYLAIKADGSAHDAGYDIELTRKLYESCK